jgi:hypothetical protein
MKAGLRRHVSRSTGFDGGCIMNVPKLTEEQLKAVFSPDVMQRAEGVVGQFHDCIVKDGDLHAKIKGNHGVYSIVLHTSKSPLQVEGTDTNTDGGSTKHMAALGLSYIYTPWIFKCEDDIDRTELTTVDDIQFYTAITPLRQLVDEMKTHKIPLTKLAEITRIPLQHISQIVRDSENGISHGRTEALKLSCLYLLDKVR